MKGKEPKVKKEKTAKSGFSTLVEKVAYALLFLLLGALAVTLAVYLPAASKLKAAQAELDRLVLWKRSITSCRRHMARWKRWAL